MAKEVEQALILGTAFLCGVRQLFQAVELPAQLVFICSHDDTGTATKVLRRRPLMVISMLAQVGAPRYEHNGFAELEGS